MNTPTRRLALAAAILAVGLLAAGCSQGSNIKKVTRCAAKVPAMLLRDLVVIIVRLAGRMWLDAHADTTAAAFCA
jgi:hypothetical protein